MTRLETAQEVNAILRHQRSAIDTTLPKMVNDGIILANGDHNKTRTFVGTIGDSVNLLPRRPWQVNMTTAPGELVFDPQGLYVYTYGGATTMTHNNPLYFPGSIGVYYWHVVPHAKDGIKIYPDISGIIVAVRKNEVWWNQAGTEKFYWKGVDNPSCVWPPVEGNEWGKVV